MHTLSLISLCTSIVAGLLALWVANNSGIRRLVKIQQRLDASMGLIIILQTRINDLEKFSSVSHGYIIRDSNSAIEDFFVRTYQDSDTGI